MTTTAAETEQDLLTRLLLERHAGMPRWQVNPSAVRPDPLPTTAARRRELVRAIRLKDRRRAA